MPRILFAVSALASIKFIISKNDAADAEAICEAVARPNMRFVPIKDVEQLGVLALQLAMSPLSKSGQAFTESDV
jgi:hypothetical protein